LTVVIGPPPEEKLIGRTPVGSGLRPFKRFTDVFLTEATIGDQLAWSNREQYAILLKTSHPCVRFAGTHGCFNFMTRFNFVMLGIFTPAIAMG
jgi:hypothetical protein